MSVVGIGGGGWGEGGAAACMNMIPGVPGRLWCHIPLYLSHWHSVQACLGLGGRVQLKVLVSIHDRNTARELGEADNTENTVSVLTLIAGGGGYAECEVRGVYLVQLKVLVSVHDGNTA